MTSVPNVICHKGFVYHIIVLQRFGCKWGQGGTIKTILLIFNNDKKVVYAFVVNKQKVIILRMTYVFFVTLQPPHPIQVK